jgi:hypothetical protein
MQYHCLNHLIFSVYHHFLIICHIALLQPLAWRGERRSSPSSDLDEPSAYFCCFPLSWRCSRLPLLRPFRLFSDFLFRRILPRLGIIAQSSASRTVLMTACLLGEWPSFAQVDAAADSDAASIHQSMAQHYGQSPFRACIHFTTS